MYPEFPPRVRLEWLIASTRVVLAGGALLAVSVNPFPPSNRLITATVMGWYLIYSLAVLALVWTPLKFARGWDVAQHVMDLVAFSLFMFLTEGVTSPFFVYFIFLMLCGTLRWQWRGALWTGSAAIAAYAGVSGYGVYVLHLPRFALNIFVIRCVHLMVVATLLGYFGAYQHRFQREISRVASWPRKVPRDPHDLIAEIIAQAAEILETPRILLVWEEPGEGYVNLAWRADSEIVWTSEPEAMYASFVVPGLEHKSFQASDAGDVRGRVISWSTGSFQYRHCRPINEPLRARFEMRAVQSWSLDGELIRGRLFGLDKHQMRIDDLILGELVARLVVSRLDSLYLLRSLRDAAALKERVRVARDLHDSLLQTLAGTGLQLLAARRLLDRDPRTAKERLGEVQDQLEHGEMEMRMFIRRLRPTTVPSDASRARLGDRLEELRRRIEQQWEIKVNLRLRASADGWPEWLVDEVFRLVREAVVNAARHADASMIRVDLSETNGGLRLEIVDDGRGFPFQGTFDLAALNEMNRGPLTLKERVAELKGDLELRSTDTGTELRIKLPLAHASS